MEDQLISFKTAKLAKEKGFNWKCRNYFSKSKHSKNFKRCVGFNNDYWGDNDNYDWNTDGEPFKPFSKEIYSSPSQSLLQKWLREIHGIHIQVQVSGQFVNGENKFYCQVVKFGENKWVSKFVSNKLYDFEEALEQGLLESLNLIKNGKRTVKIK